MGSMSSEDRVQQEFEENRCQSCGRWDVEAEYQLPLCHECRTQLAKRPVPLWIKGTAAGVALLLIYALTLFPSSLAAGIHYQRGKEAYAGHKNWTAVHEFEQAAERYPDSTKITARLFLAYYHAGGINEAVQVFSKIGGEKAENAVIADEINNAIDELDRRYYSDDELQGIYAEADLSLRIANLEKYIADHPESASGRYYLADSYFDAEQFAKVEEVILKLQETEPGFDDAELLLAAAYRELKQYDQATGITESVLARNVESDRALFALSRIELKQHKDEQGLRDAEKAYQLNPDSGAYIANLALANHYNQRLDERDRLAGLLPGREDYSQQELDKLNSVFNETTAWRD
ncbi:hypothetical protein [Paenibacillus sp. MMS20-IR301]|uniref:tetratricopeptide repeat protein n=1 Tax=Paenibacillus sp. MMS20-IR301 TaxID=2895946 RepID=UPI0028EC93ED|nr:hypothetical protein [Paenibacillus sp. MMS20-IR301]WNS45605.1 hypothetical protein LOS79_10140 [Paenibacillus sp. MMS20-IR301]